MKVDFFNTDSKILYPLIKQSFEPKSSSGTPLNSKYGSVVIKASDDVKNNRPSILQKFLTICQ